MSLLVSPCPSGPSWCPYGVPMVFFKPFMVPPWGHQSVTEVGGEGPYVSHVPHPHSGPCPLRVTPQVTTWDESREEGTFPGKI
uniref:Uncharacterized protein n=1 Tax=Phasianus colchicus TaxID=9054 RepID=A0A669QGS2_PHACC